MILLEKERISLSFEKTQKQEHYYMSSLLSRYSEFIFENRKTSQKNLINLLYDYYNAAKQHQETDFNCFIRFNTSNYFEINHHFDVFLENLEEIIEKYESGDTILDSDLFDYISMNNTGHIMLHSEKF